MFAGERFAPLSGSSKAKGELDARINALRAARGLPAPPDWTVVTMMNEKPAVPPYAVEAIVNHISGVKAGSEYVGRLETGG